MRCYDMRIVFSIVLFIGSLFLFQLNIDALERKEPVLIDQYEEDVTGDGLKEIIKLKGTFLSEESEYYHSVWAEIISQTEKKWEIHYGGAYAPKITFIDINQDKRQNLLFQGVTDDDRVEFKMHRVKNGMIHKVELPMLNYISGRFKAKSMVDVQISPHKSTISINVVNSAKKYVQHNIYNSRGELLQEMDIITQTFSHYEPVLISETKGFGLKSYPPIYGLDHSDLLGRVETLWYYMNDRWIQLRTSWV